MDSDQNSISSNKITSDNLQEYVDYIISAINNGIHDKQRFNDIVYKMIELMNDNIMELLNQIQKHKNYNTTEFEELIKKMNIISKNLVKIYHNENKKKILNNFEFQELINYIKSSIKYNITDGGGKKKQKKVKVQYKGNIYERVVKKDKNGKNCITIDNQLHLLSKLKIV